MRLIILTIALLFGNVVLFGQNTKRLSNDYSVDLSELESGVIQVEKRSYPEIYKEYLAAFNTGNSELIENEDFEAKALSMESAVLEKGEYILENESEYFEFEIGNDNELVNSVKYKDLKGNFSNEFLFEEGLVQVTKYFDDGGELAGEIIRQKNGGTLIKEYEAGNLISKKMVKKYLSGAVEEEEETYYEDGKIKSTYNSSDNILKEYYQNGKLKTYNEENEGVFDHIIFDEAGRIIFRSHLQNGDLFEEIYEKERFKMVTINHAGGEIKTIRYYNKKGLLDYYEVIDINEKSLKKFDSNGKLLSEKELALGDIK